MARSMTLDSRTLVTQISDHLRDQIISGEIAPGSRIRQDEYADAFGVSRTPLREALRLLESEGWVQIKPRSGVEVISFSPVKVQEILVMRLLLEPLAVRVGALSHTTSDATALREFIAPAENADDSAAEAYEMSNQRFHYGLYGIRAGQVNVSPIYQTLSTYWERYSRYRRVYFTRDKDSVSHSVGEHERIYAAWIDRDADRAEAELARHILGAGRSLMRSIEHDAELSVTAELKQLAERYEFDLT